LKLGKVLNLYIAPIGNSSIRESRDSVDLKANYGVVDDKFANKNLEKSVMIVGIKPYNIAKSENIKLPSCALGENILLNFDPHTLNIGTKLSIGSAVIKITEHCSICDHLIKYGKSLPKLIVKHRGVYCKVIKSGIITNNDTVEAIEWDNYFYF